MAAGDRWEVTANSGLKVRKGPGTNYASIKVLTKGTRITESEGSTSDWIKFGMGYCSKQYLKLYAPAPTYVTAKPSAPTVSKDTVVNSGSDYNDDISSGYQPDTIYSGAIGSDGTAEESDYTRISTVTGVFGLPYQFLPNTDARISNWNASSGVGKEYADKIVGKIPLLFIAPGRPDFMTRYSDSEKKSIAGQLISDLGIGRNQQGNLEDLLSTNGRYYTFRYDINAYYSYVNPMCRIAARYLEIQNFKLDNKNLDCVDWREYVLNRGSLVGNAQDYTNIPFYLDTETSVSESFDSQTTESSLASTVNGISDLGRELNFLTGYSGSLMNSDWLAEHADVATNIENVNNMINDVLGKGNFLSNLTKHLSTVASGGRLIFPKIWSDSSMSKTYNVKVKLVSPDANKLSIFLNVLVPLFHLIGLVAPQSIASNPNGYTSPFIVRAMYKSFFNVDMGIITSMSIDKGGNCGWTVDGLPTSIEVDMTIKDLYDMAFTITPTTSTNFKYDTLDNTAQLDYIANLCGINMYKPEIGRQLSMWIVNNGINRVLDVPRNIWSSLNTKISGSVQSFFRT
mgnify:FL=1|uniref:SH3 domain protein n=1 Tax=Myoviridae sp. ctwwN25 TaxID=2825209 RepID=A0A8S5PQM2_9CAUD|nr:MAG TPA: SH3 domain protein [Myoviridae sp. ctwwN25]